MIGTPVYDGKVELDFMQSMFQTLELCAINEIHMVLKTVIGCSLIHKARNELFKLAYESEVDDLIFIDSDQAWTQKDFGNLISPTVDVIGGAVVSKNDNMYYNVKTFDPHFKMYYGLIDARGVGTGFMRISKRAIKLLWDAAPKYYADGVENASVFETCVRDGQFMGEDIEFCNKWRALGEKVYVHPEISISHIGKKRWDGDFKKYVEIANANWEKSNDKSS